MYAPAEMPANLRHELESLSGFDRDGEPTDDVRTIPSLYRHLVPWPRYINWLSAAIRPVQLTSRSMPPRPGDFTSPRCGQVPHIGTSAERQTLGALSGTGSSLCFTPCALTHIFLTFPVFIAPPAHIPAGKCSRMLGM